MHSNNSIRSFAVRVFALSQLAISLTLFQLPADAVVIQGDDPAAKVLVDKLTAGEKLEDKDVERLVGLSKAKPDDAYLHYALGRYYESLNFGTLAANEYQQSADLDKSKSRYLLALSRIKLRMGDEPGARAVIAAGLGIFPKDYDILVAAGLLMQRSGDLQNADRMYLQALKFAPANADLLSARAELLLKRSRFVDAVKSAQAALKLNPDSLIAKAVLGKCLAYAGEYAGAQKYLKDTYEKGNVDADLALAYSEVLMRRRMFADALAPTLVATPFAVGKPEKLRFLKKRCEFLINKLTAEQVSNAIKLAELKLKNSKSANLYYFCLGDMFDVLNRKPEAIACYKKGLQRDPQYGRGHLRLGMDLEDFSADYDRALKEYEFAYLLLPHDDEIKLRHDRLSSRMKKSTRDIAWQIKTAGRKMKAANVQQRIQIL